MKNITIQLFCKVLLWSLLCFFFIQPSHAQVDLSNAGDIYTQDFESITTDLSEINWTVEDVNADSNPWQVLTPAINANVTANSGNQLAGYFWNNDGVTGANDWMFSNAFTLVAGQDYELRFFYAATGAGGTVFPERMRVYIGTDNSSTGMTGTSGTMIQNFDNVNNGGYVEAVLTIPSEAIPADGDYYIAWECYSAPDQFALRIDDVEFENVTQVPNDVSVTNITTTTTDPTDCSSFLTTQTFTVTVENIGTNDQSNSFGVNFTVTRDGTPITVTPSSGTIASLNAGASDNSLTFDIDMSQGGTYEITATSTLTSDENNNNDTFTTTIFNAAQDLSSEGDNFSQGFEESTNLNLLGWTTENANGDDQEWQTFVNANFSNTGSNFAICFRSNVNASDDWLFSNCIDLVAGNTYRLTFFRRANGGEDEQLALYIADTPSKAAMIAQTQLNDYGTFNENEYIEITEEFTVAASGTYYLGWNITSDATTGDNGTAGVMLDDITLLNVPSADIAISDVASVATTNTCGDFTTTTEVSVTITNEGTVAQNNFSIDYQVTDENENPLTGPTYSGTIPVNLGTPLAPGAEETFSVNIDMANFGAYIVNFTLDFPADAFSDNDENGIGLLNPLADLSNDSDEFTQGFENTVYNLTWETLQVDVGGNNWTVFSDAPFANNGDNFYGLVRNDGGGANPDGSSEAWLFSNCFELDATKAYQLEYFIRAFNGQNENLRIFLGTSATAEDMTIELANNDYSMNSYIAENIEFAVPTTGTYHIGFLASGTDLGGVTSAGLFLDDVKLTNNGDITAPNAPQNLVATSNTLKIELSWDVVTFATSYKVERRLSSGGGSFMEIATDITETSYEDDFTTAEIDNEYTYRIIAVNSVGDSDASSEANATVLGVPDAPQNLTVVSSGILEANLTWEASDRTDSYTVEKSTNGGTSFTEIATSLTSTSYTDDDFTSDDVSASVVYRVKAINIAGDSPYSNEATVTITALENSQLSQRIKAYPNPVSSEVTIDLQNLNTKELRIELVNAKGELVERYPQAAQGSSLLELSLNKQPAGLYFLKIYTDKGMAIKKLIRE